MDTDHHKNRGGWITFPFIIASTGALTLAAGGWMSNLMVYLIHEFHINSIDAALIFNIVNGSTSLIPVVAAIIADSYLGCYAVVWISSLISLVGISLLFLISTLHSLRPQPCNEFEDICKTPTTLQFTVLYIGITLACIGVGGNRSTITTMGADQFAAKPKDQGAYFNWFFVATNIGNVIASTAMVYIEDNVSWAIGFGLSLAANLLGSVIFLLGSRFYYHPKLEKRPFTDIALVIVATCQKWKVPLSSKSEDYYYGHDVEAKIKTAPTKSFRFLNRAALKTNENAILDVSNATHWKICTVSQVEELKTLFRIFPLWSTNIFLGTAIGIQSSLVILQSLTMDRHIGHRFQIPAASVLVFVLISTAISLTIFDRFLIPASKKIFNLTLSPLQRIGVGHLLTVISMALSATIEIKRRKLAQSERVSEHSVVVPMSVFWLVPQLAMTGMGSAFHFPGQVNLYYQEFPTSLKSMSTAMNHLIIGIAFYMCSVLIDFIRKLTNWLPDDINNGRLDNVYWVLVVIGILNFYYFLVCAFMYKYQNVDKDGEDSRF